MDKPLVRPAAEKETYVSFAPVGYTSGGVGMINQQDLFIMDLDVLHEDLYRMGNASSANFSEQRGLVDCQVVDRAGVPTVLANGNGFSAFNRITAVMKRPGRHVWKIKRGSRLPPDIRLVADRTNPGHYMFAPAYEMPFQKFLGLLEGMAANRSIAVKLSPQEIRHAG